MRIIAEGALKGRTFADGGIDQITPLGMVARIDIRSVGNQQFSRRIRKLPKHRLAADHHYVIDVGDGSRGTDYMLQLRARHTLGAAPSANAS